MNCISEKVHSGFNFYNSKLLKSLYVQFMTKRKAIVEIEKKFILFKFIEKATLLALKLKLSPTLISNEGNINHLRR